jgi:very-short-patch-repair endonuclease
MGTHRLGSADSRCVWMSFVVTGRRHAVPMHTTSLDARIGLVANRQACAFTWAQARSCGFGRATIGRRLRSGAWVRRIPGVYALAGAPTTRWLELWSGVLAAGEAALVSHESGALAHGARGLPPHPVTLTARHGSHHRLPGITVHQIDDVARHHRTTIGGLPVVTAARSVVDLASRLPLDRLGDVADDLVQARATSWPAIGAVVRDVLRPGKPGIVTLASLLDDRCGTRVPPASKLERALFTALAAAGLPEPVRQMPLPGRGRVRGLVDAAYPDARIVLEADGRTYHMRLRDMRRDRERDAQVVKAGWVTMRFVYEQVCDEPAGVCADILETRRVRLPLFANAA